MLDVERRGPILIRIVAMNSSLRIDVFKRAFDANARSVEPEMKLPGSESDELKLLANKKLQTRRVWKLMHAAIIANLMVIGNDRFPPQKPPIRTGSEWPIADIASSLL